MSEDKKNINESSYLLDQETKEFEIIFANDNEVDEKTKEIIDIIETAKFDIEGARKIDSIVGKYHKKSEVKQETKEQEVEETSSRPIFQIYNSPKVQPEHEVQKQEIETRSEVQERPSVQEEKVETKQEIHQKEEIVQEVQTPEIQKPQEVVKSTKEIEQDNFLRQFRENVHARWFSNNKQEEVKETKQEVEDESAYQTEKFERIETKKPEIKQKPQVQVQNYEQKVSDSYYHVPQITSLIKQEINKLKVKYNFVQNVDLLSTLKQSSVQKGLKQLRLFLKTSSYKIFADNITSFDDETKKKVLFIISLWEKFSWINNSSSEFQYALDKNTLLLIRKLVLTFQIAIYKKIGLKKLFELDKINYYIHNFNDLLYLANQINWITYFDDNKMTPPNISTSEISKIIEHINWFKTPEGKGCEVGAINIINRIFQETLFSPIESFNINYYTQYFIRREFNSIFTTNNVYGNNIDFQKIVFNNSIDLEELKKCIVLNLVHYAQLKNKEMINDNERIIITSLPRLMINMYELYSQYYNFESYTENLLPEPKQWLIFGAPGTGKSYFIEEVINKYKNSSEIALEHKRLTFHIGTSYSNFIGSYKPVANVQGKNTVKFIPGEFTKMLASAYKNPDINYVCVIEEINRADSSNVFGEFFQLLDRNEHGNSSYAVSISYELSRYLFDEEKIDPLDKALNTHEALINQVGEQEWEIKLPANLYIWATMNGAVSSRPIDPAFKRRWTLLYKDYNSIPKNINKIWNTFRENINNILIRVKVPEDRLLGYWYLHNLIDESSDEETIKIAVRDKVLPYLFNDVVKIRRDVLAFNELDYATLSLLRENFDRWWNRFKISSMQKTNEEIEKISDQTEDYD
ncbi:AAA family ATPase [Metamycoplasma hyosynoviae]|uniref:AAA family ATPase n=1 Tax=Metamycoplasma hyosynoviae TaxID=29559 RepID=UPI00235F2F15|nr:AAA family ATPase [Metamycoplasma hyosynoviae]MDD1375120.1 AAA family ATPase [Metamycoplasma hyosynoviae]